MWDLAKDLCRFDIHSILSENSKVSHNLHNGVIRICTITRYCPKDPQQGNPAGGQLIVSNWILQISTSEINPDDFLNGS